MEARLCTGAIMRAAVILRLLLLDEFFAYATTPELLRSQT